MLLAAVLILGFPRELPRSKEMRDKAIKEGYLPKQEHKLKGRLRDIVPATVQLIKNPTYMFNALALTAGSAYGAGIGAFIAKFSELKFGINPAIAGFTLGTVFIVGAAGTGLSSVILPHFNTAKLEVNKPKGNPIENLFLVSSFRIVTCSRLRTADCMLT